MDRLTVNDINNIRNSVDIVEVISEYIPLESKGKNYFGVCPFHDDNHPSMSVSKEKQIYTCFSCGATGNVFKFLMDFKSITFREALTILADKSGININVNEIKEHNHTNSKLYDAYDLALKFYQNNINTKEGISAKKYLMTRNIDDDVIKEFEIGLSLSKPNLLYKLLDNKGFDNKTMLDSGLVSSGSTGYFDMYRSRIMFPLYDTFGKPVGFSGRIYNSEDTSKYINTKETPIFKKGELLYNYHRAKNETVKTKTIIIMEGFMDVIRAYTIGVKNVVASMGTAITKEQALLLKRLAPNIILLFDGDKAGEKATNACIEELQKIGVTPKVVRLEDNLDPDEYILKYGKEQFLDKINNPMNVMDFKLSSLKGNVNLDSTIEKSDYVKKILLELSKIDDNILRELTLQKLSVDSNLNMEFLKGQLEGLEPKKEIIVPDKKEKVYSKYEQAERTLIHYMLNNKEVINIYNNKAVYLPDENYRHLAREIVSYYKINGIISSADLITELLNYNKPLVDLLGNIESYKYNEEFTLNEIVDYINVILDYNIKMEVKHLKEEMAKQVNPIKKAELAQKIVDLKIRREENDKRD